MASFHPNAAGQQAYAKAFARVLGARSMFRTFDLLSALSPGGLVDLGTLAVEDHYRQLLASVSDQGVTLQAVAPDGTVYSAARGNASTGTGPAGSWIQVKDAQVGSWVIQASADAPVSRQVTASAVALADPIEFAHALASVTVVDAASGRFAFDGSASTGPTNDPVVSYQWQFADGTTGSGPVVEYTFSSSDLPYAILTAATASGVLATTTVEVPAGIAAPPSAPGSPAASRTADALTVTWTPPATNGGAVISGYDVRYRVTPTGTWTLQKVDTSATTWTVTGLDPAASYDVEVAAVNSAGSGAAAGLTVPGQSSPSDTVPPVVTGSLAPVPNAQGWNNGPVTVTWTATDPDPSSGGLVNPTPTTVSSEGREQVVTSDRACDAAGNCATGSVTVAIDLTAPTITTSVADALAGSVPGAKVVHFDCADALSGIATCPADVPIVADMTSPVSGTATDNAGNSATDTIEVSAPAFTSGAPTSATVVGTPYAFAFTATGIPLPTFSVVEGALPTGLSLAPSGELTGSASATGTYTFRIAATSTTGQAVTDPYTITVRAAEPQSLAINTASLPGGFVGRPYAGSVEAVGGTRPYAWQVRGKLPPGLAFDGATGQLSGVPTKAGTYSITVTVTDSSAARSRVSTALTLTISDPLIQVQPTKLANGKVGHAYSVTFSATGGTSPYTYSLEGMTTVSGMTLSGSGILSGQPLQKGTFTFAVRVVDADGAVGWRQYTLTVR